MLRSGLFPDDATDTTHQPGDQSSPTVRREAGGCTEKRVVASAVDVCAWRWPQGGSYIGSMSGGRGGEVMWWPHDLAGSGPAAGHDLEGTAAAPDVQHRIRSLFRALSSPPGACRTSADASTRLPDGWILCGTCELATAASDSEEADVRTTFVPTGPAPKTSDQRPPRGLRRCPGTARLTPPHGGTPEHLRGRLVCMGGSHGQRIGRMQPRLFQAGFESCPCHRDLLHACLVQMHTARAKDGSAAIPG